MTRDAKIEQALARLLAAADGVAKWHVLPAQPTGRLDSALHFLRWEANESRAALALPPDAPITVNVTGYTPKPGADIPSHLLKRPQGTGATRPASPSREKCATCRGTGELACGPIDAYACPACGGARRAT